MMIENEIGDAAACPSRKNFLWRIDHELKCAACGKANTIQETMYALTLQIEPDERESVETLLERFFATESVHRKCDDEACRHETSQSSRRIVSQPKILLLHLKRFSATYERGEVSGVTLLMGAANHGHERVVELLIRRGAEVNLQSSHGRTALMFAVFFNRPAVVRRLLRAGADAAARDENGKTALQMAKEEGHAECVEAFKNYVQEVVAGRPAATAAGGEGAGGASSGGASSAGSRVAKTLSPAAAAKRASSGVVAATEAVIAAAERGEEEAQLLGAALGPAAPLRQQIRLAVASAARRKGADCGPSRALRLCFHGLPLAARDLHDAAWHWRLRFVPLSRAARRVCGRSRTPRRLRGCARRVRVAQPRRRFARRWQDRPCGLQWPLRVENQGQGTHLRRLSGHV